MIVFAVRIRQMKGVNTTGGESDAEYLLLIFAGIIIYKTAVLCLSLKNLNWTA